ncbi:aminoglycoside N(3)-acetyltransferase [Natronosalvus caseinilyticus]|uniref:aminoglycoside N(3)-acetyltransferase n=1 Tax=Natronosalvus caseinilyticus TaxID=2953747 RepID=UPI0028AE8DDA|nr:AAC(3) family N-acetyltransferase [Natronosalvus caseinilyticus]
MSLTREELRGGFRGLGLEAGDSVIVHSSLSSLGWVDGGARTVVDALCDTVGDGTVLMPTFTRYDRAYDPEMSPSTVGAITEACRNHPEAVRSAHPTKSVAAIGPGAESLVADHELRNSIGPGSPIHRLIDERDGQILLLGVDHTTNSALHVAERLANLPYRDQLAETTMRGADGSAETVEVNQVHCSRGFGVVGSIATRLGLEREGRVGDATARLVDGPRLLSLVVEVLDKQPGLLLCDVPDCERCAYARRRIADWQ